MKAHAPSSTDGQRDTATLIEPEGARAGVECKKALSGSPQCRLLPFRNRHVQQAFNILFENGDLLQQSARPVVLHNRRESSHL
jgi:hypothetical protein